MQIYTTCTGILHKVHSYIVVCLIQEACVCNFVGIVDVLQMRCNIKQEYQLYQSITRMNACLNTSLFSKTDLTNNCKSSSRTDFVISGFHWQKIRQLINHYSLFLVAYFNTKLQLFDAMISVSNFQYCKFYNCLFLSVSCYHEWTIMVSVKRS